MKFDLWKENKLDQHYQLTAEEFKTKFIDWVKTRDKEWLDYRGLDQVIVLFISMDHGLDSTFDYEQMGEMSKVVEEDYYNIIG